jgi:uncharacterized membrane protein (UPF0127 family)
MQFPLSATLHTPEGSQSLQLKWAKGLWSRFRGLMLTRKLGSDPIQGLFIPRCPSVHGFFMLYSLDIVYLASEERDNCYSITHTSRLRPWMVSFGRNRKIQTGQGVITKRSQHALELPAGIVELYRIQPGQLLEVHTS